MIDTLSYTRDLMKAGLSEEQAELMVRSQFQMISNNVATKADLAELRNELKDIRIEIKDIRSDMKDIRTDLKDIRTDLKTQELRLVRNLSAVIIFLFGAIATIQSYFLSQTLS